MPLRVGLTDRTRLMLVALVTAGVIACIIFVGVALVPARYSSHIQAKWVRFALVTTFWSTMN